MARLYWGSDGKLWGGEELFWGMTDEEIDALPPVWFHVLIRTAFPAPDGVVRIWTGVGDLTLDVEDGDGEQTWTGGGGLLEVSPARVETGPSSDALTIQVNAIPDEERARWAVPVGGTPVSMRYIASEDHGVSWTLIPVVRAGVLSGPTIGGGVYSVDIVNEYALRERAHPLTWSDEDHRARYPGDSGLSGMRSLAGGVDLFWPN